MPNATQIAPMLERHAIASQYLAEHPEPVAAELATSTDRKLVEEVLTGIVAHLRYAFAESYADDVLEGREPDPVGRVPLEDIAGAPSDWPTLETLGEQLATVAAELWAVKVALAAQGITVPTLADMLHAGGATLSQ